VKKYKLRGLYSGMIISEVDEAYMYGLSTDYKTIQQSNLKLAKALRESFQVDEIRKLYSANTDVERFNELRLFFREGMA
jgi:hypothetical protein